MSRKPRVILYGDLLKANGQVKAHIRKTKTGTVMVHEHHRGGGSGGGGAKPAPKHDPNDVLELEDTHAEIEHQEHQLKHRNGPPPDLDLYSHRNTLHAKMGKEPIPVPAHVHAAHSEKRTKDKAQAKYDKAESRYQNELDKPIHERDPSIRSPDFDPRHDMKKAKKRTHAQLSEAGQTSMFGASKMDSAGKTKVQVKSFMRRTKTGVVAVKQHERKKKPGEGPRLVAALPNNTAAVTAEFDDNKHGDNPPHQISNGLSAIVDGKWRSGHLKPFLIGVDKPTVEGVSKLITFTRASGRELDMASKAKIASAILPELSKRIAAASTKNAAAHRIPPGHQPASSMRNQMGNWSSSASLEYRPEKGDPVRVTFVKGNASHAMVAADGKSKKVPVSMLFPSLQVPKPEPKQEAPRATSPPTAPTARAPTDRQLNYAMRLLGRVRGADWFDTDMGDSGIPKPTRHELSTWNSRDVSALISELKDMY